MPYVITDLCTRDGACVDVCPVACIHTTPEAPQFYVDPEICIECEQCKIVCPVEAIFLDLDLPELYQPSAEVNASFFRKHKEAAEPISLEAALRMVESAQAYARRMGHQIAVVVVDGSGAPVAVSKMDRASPSSSELALSKAITAAAFLVPTDQLVGEGKRPAFRSLVIGSRGKIIAAGGGIPLVDGITLIGAIGVAGSDTEGADLLCSRAGLAALVSASH